MPARSRLFLMILFAGAGVGLLMQIFTVSILSQRLMAISLVFMCIEQARMAIVDLTNIHAVSNCPELTNTEKLQHFHQITLSTIAMELIGFYTSVQWLGWGCVIVLLSQVWFNALAGVKLTPEADDIVMQDFGIKARTTILLADCITVLVTILYVADVLPLLMAIILLAIVCLYFLIKYGPALSAQVFTQSYQIK